MAKHFSEAEWSAILDLARREGARFGLPEPRDDAILIGSFNIRKLGDPDGRSQGAWDMLKLICERFDLLAIQEVQDNLKGLRKLVGSLEPPDKYGIVASDITGGYPGEPPPPERLAFVFRWDRLTRTEIASDITYDRKRVVDTLYDSRTDFWRAFDTHTGRLGAYEEKRKRRETEGKRAPAKPSIRLPAFVTFIRQPLCVSFAVKAARGGKALKFLAVNAHLLYGESGNRRERRLEFFALVEWLVDRARNPERMYYPNLVLLGDCNLEIDTDERRSQVDSFVKSLNQKRLADTPAELNFPFLTTHPEHGRLLRSTARQTQTYDQIGFICHEGGFPRPPDNATARRAGAGFYYDVFDFTELVSQALDGRSYSDLDDGRKDALIDKFQHDLSDHLPIWVRLPKP